MIDSTIRRIIRNLLDAGGLPKEPARQMRASYGDGAVCDVCRQPTEPSTVAYRMRVGVGEAAQSVLMHCACFDVWETERKVAGSEERASS